MSSDDTLAVIAPTPDGRWRAAHGIGSYTRECGQYDTEQQARDAAGVDGRWVIVARLGESGWEAYARAGRERTAATVGIRVDWMHAGTVTAVTLTPEQVLVLRWPHGRPMGELYDPAGLPTRADVRQTRVTLALQGLLAVDLGRQLTGEMMLGGAARAQDTTVDQLVGDLPSDRWSRTELGDLVLDARAEGHMDRSGLVCDGYGPDWTATHGSRCHCLGQVYLGDLETEPTRAVVVLVDPVGLVEISQRLGVSRTTVDQWRFDARGTTHFPLPDAHVGGRPAWSWADTIRPWAIATGRLTQEET